MIGGLLTSAFSWRSIFVVQIPVVLLALPAALALRGRVVRREANPDTSPDRPHVLANLALALLSAALTAALFLLVLLLVEGWRRSPAVAAVAVTAVPVAALAAGPLFRRVRAGTRSEAVAGSVLIAGGLAGLALLPGAELAWTIAPQVLVGLGLGLSVDSLTAAALRDRIPRALHGGWTIAARHAGVVAGLAILTPIFTADLRHAETPAKEAVASLVLDAPLPASTKLELADGLGRQLVAERGRVPDLRPAFATLRLPAAQAATAAALERDLDDQLRARRDPRVPHRLPRRGAAGAAGAGARAGAARPEPAMRALALPLIAVLLVAAVLGAQVAAGGGDYVPRRPADPCAPRAIPPIPAQLEPVAERIVLLGLDSAACRLGISRERLVLALADTRSLDPDAPAALKAGLRDAVDRLDREGRLPKVSQLLPEVLDQADLPGIVKTVIARDPGRRRRRRPPDRAAAAPRGRRARRRRARPRARRPGAARVGHPVGDPQGRARPDPRPPAPLGLDRAAGSARDGELQELDADGDRRVGCAHQVRSVHLDGVFPARRDRRRLHDVDREAIDALRSQLFDPRGGDRPERPRQLGAQAEVDLIPGKESAKATGFRSRVLGVHAHWNAARA